MIERPGRDTSPRYELRHHRPRPRDRPRPRRPRPRGRAAPARRSFGRRAAAPLRPGRRRPADVPVVRPRPWGRVVRADGVARQRRRRRGRFRDRDAPRPARGRRRVDDGLRPRVGRRARGRRRDVDVGDRPHRQLAPRRPLVGVGRQGAVARPARPPARDVEHGRLQVQARHGPAVQVGPVRAQAAGRRLGRPVLRQHAARELRRRRGRPVADVLPRRRRRPRPLRGHGAEPARGRGGVLRDHRENADDAEVGARVPPVPVLVHGRGRDPRGGPGLPRAPHPVRRALLRHPLHAGLPRVHLGPRPVPRPRRPPVRSWGRRVQVRRHRRPRRQGRRSWLRRLPVRPRGRRLRPLPRRRRGPGRGVARRRARSRTLPRPRSARGGASCTAASSRTASTGSGTT